jgi:hypothetical protein
LGDQLKKIVDAQRKRSIVPNKVHLYRFLGNIETIADSSTTKWAATVTAVLSGNTEQSINIGQKDFRNEYSPIVRGAETP